ncbi:MAG: type III-A CRISPR-associated protein Csm2 [Desulfobacterales bacterium]|nr:type III-A CRISPR-associated protein Csm2 [Desulfobacterales bacterium]
MNGQRYQRNQGGYGQSNRSNQQQEVTFKPINFWKDRVKELIEPSLFSEQAEEFAKEIANDNSNNKKFNKRTQLRKFYDEVVYLEVKSRNTNFDTILPFINMLVAKAAYADGRELISKNFFEFIKISIKEIKTKSDLKVFTNFFEAFMGFYRSYGPSN